MKLIAGLMILISTQAFAEGIAKSQSSEKPDADPLEIPVRAEEMAPLSRCKGKVTFEKVENRVIKNRFHTHIYFDVEGEEALDLYKKMKAKNGSDRTDKKVWPDRLHRVNNSKVTIATGVACWFKPDLDGKLSPGCNIETQDTNSRIPILTYSETTFPKLNGTTVFRCDSELKCRIGIRGPAAGKMRQGLRGGNSPLLKCDDKEDYCEVILQLSHDYPNKIDEYLPIEKMEHLSAECEHVS